MLNLFLLIVFILVCYGLSNMVVYSNGPFHIFAKWRVFTNRLSPKFGELFTCMMCFPFWAGVLISAINLFLIGTIAFTPFSIILLTIPPTVIKTIIVLLFDGLISSGTTWILHNVEEYFESNSKFE